MLKYLVFSILVLVFGMVSCKRKEIDFKYVKSSQWQWNKGFKIGDGDFVGFDTTNFHTITHDTIFRKGVPRCIIIEINKANYLMKVKSLKDEIGYYDDSEQFTK